MTCFLRFILALPFMIVSAAFTFMASLFVNSSEFFLWIATLIGTHEHHHEDV